MVESANTENSTISLAEHSDSILFEHLSYLFSAGVSGDVIHLYRRLNEEGGSYIYSISSDTPGIISQECQCQSVVEALVIFAVSNQYLLSVGINYLDAPAEELLAAEEMGHPVWGGGRLPLGDLAIGCMAPVYEHVKFIEDDVCLNMPSVDDDALCQKLEKVMEMGDGLQLRLVSPGILSVQSEDVSEYIRSLDFLSQVLSA